VEIIDIEGTISEITSCLIHNASNFKTLWFRGQPDFQHQLLPSIFRQGNIFKVEFNEHGMFEEFKRRYPEQSSNHTTTYEWLTLMQHYGLPTRLLDWSSNLLVALYFCCANDIDKDGGLYAFDPTFMERDFQFNEFLEMQIQEKSRSDFFNRIIYKMDTVLDEDSKLNGISIGRLRSNLYERVKFTGLSAGSSKDFESLTIKQELPSTKDMNGNIVPYVEQDIKRAFSNIVPFKAPHLNSRTRLQHGFFTFHGGMYIDGKEFIPVENMEQHTYSEKFLLKIRIKAKDKISFLKELEYVGIREATLFPEMEYQAREIKHQFSIKKS